MFVDFQSDVPSTRRLIHRTLLLTQRNNKNTLTRREKNEHRQGLGNCEFYLLSYLSERGLLLQYARQVEILNPAIYTWKTFYLTSIPSDP